MILLLFCRWVGGLDLINFIMVTQWVWLRGQLVLILKILRPLLLIYPELFILHIDGLMQERRNCIVNALELRLSCTNPSMWKLTENVCHFADLFLNCISLTERSSNFIKLSQKLAPGGLIDNMIVLVQVMAWCQTTDKPLPEAVMTEISKA